MGFRQPTQGGLGYDNRRFTMHLRHAKRNMHNFRLFQTNPSTTNKNKLTLYHRRVTTRIPLSITRSIPNQTRNFNNVKNTSSTRHYRTNTNLINKREFILPGRQLPRTHRRALFKSLLRRSTLQTTSRHRHRQLSTTNLKNHFTKRNRDHPNNVNNTRINRQTLHTRQNAIKRTSRHTRLRRNLVMITKNDQKLIFRSANHRYPLSLKINSRTIIIM